MQSFSSQTGLSATTHQTRKLQRSSFALKLWMIFGGMMVAPLVISEMAIAQTFPRYDVRAQHSGGSCLPIRAEPNPSAYMVDCVSNGSVLIPVVRERDGWVQLENGHWTWKDSTSLITEATIGARSPSKASNQRQNTTTTTTRRSIDPPREGITVQTSVDCSNVRRAPSLNGDIVACVGNDEVLKPVIAEQGDWLQLSSGNWIWRNNTSY